MLEDNLDIFSVSLPTFYKPAEVITIKGKISDNSTGQPIVANLKFEKTDQSAAGEVKSNEDGTYEILLPGGEYTILVSRQGYETNRGDLNINQPDQNEVVRDFGLSPKKVVDETPSYSPVPLYFNLDDSGLSSDTRKELDQLADYLGKTDTKVEITGHTCDLGSASYNLKLSDLRCDRVAEYLVEKGIDKDRISKKGLGETMPAVPNDRPKNRRVEIRINP
jgi:outer membrane protein OmpA-like peptidoglycan-associated protein